jgi:hypothetical protein
MVKYTITNRVQAIRDFAEQFICFANKAYQWRTWINAEGPECSSYEDDICNFCQAYEYYHSRLSEYELTETQKQAVEQLKSAIDYFLEHDQYKFDIPDFIEEPEWDKVVQSARKAVLEFRSYYDEPLLGSVMRPLITKKGAIINDFSIKVVFVSDDCPQMVIQIVYKGLLFAEMPENDAGWLMNFHPHPEGKAWEIPFEELIVIFEEIQKMMTGAYSAIHRMDWS